MCPVGGPHLPHNSTAFFDHIWDSEGAADLHQLPPGDNHFLFIRHSIERQYEGSGVVVHRQGSLRPGKGSQQC